MSTSKRKGSNSNKLKDDIAAKEAKRIVRAAAGYIEDDVIELTKDSKILNNNNTKKKRDAHSRISNRSSNKKDLDENGEEEDGCSHIALFHRHEITVGDLLGKGSFANVYEVTGFRLDEKRFDPRSPEYRILKNVKNSNDRAKKKTMERGGEKNEGTDDNHDHQSEPDSKYAIKFLKKRLIRETDDFIHYAADLIIEAKIMSALNHPNIIKIRSLPVDGAKAYRKGGHFDSYFMLMDKLDATLDNKILSWKTIKDNDDPKTFRELKLLQLTASYALQIAGALKYIHSRGFIYRDVKPENVGLSNDHTVQLFDFGLCREMPAVAQEKQRSNDDDDYYNLEKTNNETFLMSGAGSKRYMAPEIVNTSCYNTKADVYSWSMIYYEMISLIKPFKGYDESMHRELVCEKGQRPPLQHLELPGSIKDILKKSWHQEVPKRYTIQKVCSTMQNIVEDAEAYMALEDLNDMGDYTRDSDLDDSISNLEDIFTPSNDSKDKEGDPNQDKRSSYHTLTTLFTDSICDDSFTSYGSTDEFESGFFNEGNFQIDSTNLGEENGHEKTG